MALQIRLRGWRQFRLMAGAQGWVGLSAVHKCSSQHKEPQAWKFRSPTGSREEP